MSSEAHPLTQIAVARRCGSNAAICDSEDACYLEQPKATKSFIVPIISAVTISTAKRRIILIQPWLPPPPRPAFARTSFPDQHLQMKKEKKKIKV